MRASFASLLRKSVSLQSLLGFDWTCVSGWCRVAKSEVKCLTPTPGVLRNPTPTPPKKLRLLATPTPQPCSWCTSEMCKCKRCNRNGGRDDFLLHWNIDGKKHTAYLALTASRFSQAHFHESYTSKWWFWSKEETWNVTKNKLLKLVNSVKANFLFAGLNLNTIVQKKMLDECTFYGWCFKNKGQKKLKCWDSVVVCPLSKFLSTRLLPVITPPRFSRKHCWHNRRNTVLNAVLHRALKLWTLYVSIISWKMIK